jgi:DHA2 family multidrug resistance protein
MVNFEKFRQNLVAKIPPFNPEHKTYRWLVLTSIIIGTFMAMLDSSIVNVSMPKIMATFGTSIDKITWISTAYTLVFSLMLPTSGWLADRFGYKRTYFTALLIFTTGSLLCGTSWNEDILIFFRIIQAVGGGILMPVGMTIISREFSPEQRGKALGFWSIAGAASASFGPLIGGYLVDTFRWQAIFSINVPVGCICMLATWVIQREYKSEKSGPFDVPGFLSMATFLTFLLVALTNGNSAWNIGGWTSGFILACFALSMAGLLIFLIREFSAKSPLVDLRLFKDYTFTLCNFLLFIFGLGLFGSTFIQPLYLQNALGYTAMQAGMFFLPMGLIQATMSPVSGIMADKLNPKIPLLLGSSLMGISLYLNGFLSLFSGYPQIMLPIILRGFGMGLMITPLMSVAMVRIPKEKMAQASGVLNLLRQVGGSFGVAILGTLLIQRQIFHTAMLGQSVQTVSPFYKNLVTGCTALAKAKTGTSFYYIKAALQAKSVISSYLSKLAYVQAINDCYLVAAILSLFSILLIFLFRTKAKTKAGLGRDRKL